MGSAWFGERYPLPASLLFITLFVCHFISCILAVTPAASLRFTKRAYNVTIPENSISKTYVRSEEKMGIYCEDPNLEIRYKIVSGNKESFFRANEKLVGDFWFLLIRTRTDNIDVLNREGKSHYSLVVKATITSHNRGKHIAETEATVFVTVLDTNDMNPLFLSSDYYATIPEDTALHTSILKVEAEDADLGINGEVYYYFKESPLEFAVHPTTGVITLVRPLKYAERSLHEFVVLAKDRGAVFRGATKPSSAKVRIVVSQVNLYSPEIYVRSLPTVVEQSVTDIYAIVRVMDKDLGIHGQIEKLEIVGGDPDRCFKIRRTKNESTNFLEYNLEVLKLLDREKAPQGYNLTLRAVDKGTPPRETFKSVPITLVDVNDNAPVFDREVYEVNISETAPINSPVVRVKVTDPDQGKNAEVALEIVGGNEGKPFRIRSSTGMLYTSVPLDAEIKPFYSLTVSALDQGNVGSRKQTAAKIKINVVDANDNDPVFETTETEIWVNENEPAGTSVTKVLATDKDSGENRYISYSIMNLDPVPFEIDHFAGIIRTSQVLDYETMRREYNLKIRASDWGLPYRRQAEMQLKIKVKDVNDNRPQFEKVDCVGHISKTVPIGYELMTLSAIDFDAGNIISYRLVSGNEDGCFTLDSSSGIISVTCDLNDIPVNVRELNVTATDSTHFSDTVRIRINLVQVHKNTGKSDEFTSFECRDTGVTRRLTEILAISEKNNAQSGTEEFAMLPSRYGENVHTPEFVNFPTQLHLNESMPLGSVLAKIRARDRDLGYNGKLVYGISSGDDDSAFKIDPDSGEVKLVGYLDRERSEEYTLNITVYDLGKPQKSMSRFLSITVLDVNDNAPKFEKNLIYIKIRENTPNGTAIFTLNATDIDTPENAQISYSMVTDCSDFAIDSALGIIFISNPLDREKQDFYELTFKATDNPNDLIALSSEALIRITLEDVNDNAPNFSSSTYIVRVREDLPVGSVVTTLLAQDPDSGLGGEVQYTLSAEIEEDMLFNIDEIGGIVRLTRTLDFEKHQVHTLVIRAKDRGTPSLFNETVLQVEVIDVNENLNPPVFDDFVVSALVTENYPIGTTVARVRAVDNDPPGDDSRIAYSIREGDGLGYFSIDNEGVIKTLAVLDAETKSRYWLTVFAQDHGVVPLHSILYVHIKVMNINDNVPLTTSPVYFPHVMESSSPAHTRVVVLRAEDKDLEVNKTLSYRITAGNADNLFSIDQTSGIITTAGRKLDREEQSEHVLEVTVTDNGSPSLSSTTQVIVIIDDENDNAPQFLSVNDNTVQFQNTFYKFRIPETKSGNNAMNILQNISTENELNLEGQSENNTWEHFDGNVTSQPLFRVIAFDPDLGDNGKITYSLNGGRFRGVFNINAETGVVYSDKTFLAGDEYKIQVRATDNGTSSKSSVVDVAVFVSPLPEKSEHAPVIRDFEQQVDITENDSPGFLVALVQASDEDGDLLWYKIEGGDPRSEFTIGENGNIILAKKVDCETQDKYNLIVSVSDGTNKVHAQVYINVVDNNEYRPMFTSEIFTVGVTENATVGSSILQLNTTDADRNSKLFFSIHNAQNQISLKLFNIDYDTGLITLAESLDRESISQHVLTVMVKDEDTPAKRNFARIIIDVFDANDHAPEFSAGIIQGRIFETATVGTTVLQVLATDKDHGHNAAITYHISSGNTGNMFSIHESLGIIQVAREFDPNFMHYEYVLNVKATDMGSPPLSSSITAHIIVTMADNAPPKFANAEVSAELYENEPIGTVVKCLEAKSTSSVIFEIIEGNAADMFEINPSTGVVLTKRFLDYETNRLYNLTITATNMASAKAVCFLIVHVLDRNDNAPYFVETDYIGYVSESAPVGSLALTPDSLPLVLKAKDEDTELNSLLQYEIVEATAKRMFHVVSNTGAIRTVVTLDYEAISKVEFHVRVVDHGKPRLSSEVSARVRVNIIDVNDCPPVFTQSEYNAKVVIPTYTGIAVLQLNATDSDSKNLTKLVYSITDGNSGNVYSIVPETGLITIHDAVAGAQKDLHKLKVQVTDGFFVSESYVNVRWQKSEDSGLVFQKSVYHGVVQENKTKVTTVVVVNVIGSALNENLLFSILNPSPYFTIGPTSGAIRTTGLPFDREAQEFHLLIVQAESSEEGIETTRMAHVPVNVTVLDENDNCPMFVNLPYYAVASVDSRRGDVVAEVHAIDLDKGENGEVRYELSKGNGELFKVDRKTGEISLKQTLEGHNKEYQLVITAHDGGLSPCLSQATVNLKVMDKSMPIFDKQFYSVSVPEDTEIYTPLMVSIKAESPLARKLIYSISSGNSMEQFAIDFNTGALYIVDQLDYEVTKEYALIIRATDSISGIYAEVLANVLVADVNDCPPEFPQDFYNVSISEAAAFGSLILKIHAYDNDTGKNSVIQYSIQRDNENATDNIHVDPEDGSIFLKRSLDRETRTLHHIVVIATDGGIPPLSSTAHIWIHVLDVNDNAPKFEETSYVAQLSEDAVRGQFVIMVSANDPDIIDQGNLIYNIVGGNLQQTFTLDTTTGIITVANLQKLANSTTHSVNVSVSDGVYTSFARVRIEMQPANHHTPVFERSQYEMKIVENAPPGLLVAHVHAIDKDPGLYGQISYWIPSQKVLELFHINNITGEVFTKHVLNREEKRMYEIVVIGTDGGGRSGSTLVRVTVDDVNDNKPEFLLTEYKACIYSNLVTNSFFLKVKATDEDDESASRIEYSIYENEPKGVTELFGINKNTGGLVLLKSAKPYENQVFQFFVRASDCGTPPLYSDVPVDVYIMSLQDTPPVFEKNDDRFFVTENASIGHVITKLKPVTGTNVKYKIVSPSDTFQVDDDGQLMVNKKLDREQTSLYVVGMVAYTDSSPPLSTLAEIYVQVLDTNDNSPEFDSSVYYANVAENIPEGSSVVRVHATDEDEGKNSEIRYSMETETDVFSVDTFTGWVITSGPLDRESKAVYTLNVIATDNGVPPLSGSCQVVVSLVDYNDNPSSFEESHYEATVKENALAGTVVAKLTLSDADLEIPSNIAFHIVSGNLHAQFAIRNTGEVYVVRPLDRETVDSYKMDILTTDGKFVASTKLSVLVEDVNDERPYCLKHRYRKVISESAASGTSLLNILASDNDQDPKLRFYLTGPGAEYFSLDRNLGELKIARPLDREVQSKFELMAHVQDREQTEWECQSEIEISVLDVNDNSPVFSSHNNTASVPEDAVIGTLITKMHATDADAGANRKIKYSLLNSANGHFIIAPDSGIITLAKPLDREIQSSYSLTVKATDQGSPQLSSVTSLLVIVLDVNDNPPEFVSRSYYSSISESAPVGTEIIQVMATSLDIGLNAKIVYSIVGGNEHGKFSIAPETGIITVSQLLDYERVRDYLLQIQATDLGVPPLYSQATVNITIIDANDNPPVFTQLSYSAHIPEDIPIGDIVLKVSATDVDSGVNGKIKYTLERGDRYQQFAVDANTGHITIARPLDRELIPNYTLQIRASDNGIPELSNFALISIEVDDVNDNPPFFSQSNYSCIIQEDKRPGWPVCQLNVTDADADPNGPPFVFDILSGNAQGSFRLDADGTVRTSSRLKYKVQEVHNLHVRVFDNGIPPRYSDTQVTIKVIEESQYPPSAIPLDIWVGSYQDRWPGGQLGRVHASDQDPYDTLLYNVLLPHHGLFNIDERTGVLSSASGLDTGEYVLNISVTDGKFTSYAPVHVNVDPLYEDMLNDGISVRLRGITPHHFILSQGKALIRTLKSILMRDVQLVSIQEAPQGHLDILLLVKGGIDLNSMHHALQTAGLTTVIFPCNCVQNQGICKQRITFLPDQIQLIATDVTSFVAPAHSQQLYCSCLIGYAGSRCENKVHVDCSCPPSLHCVHSGNESVSYKCVTPPVVATSCDKNATCPPFASSTFYTVTLEQLIGVGSIVCFILLVLCFILICRKCRRTHSLVPQEDKNITYLNSDYKRNSKINNFEVTQCPMRPASYTAMMGNNDLYVTATQLNNLDTLRSYGSAGDELENIPADYVRNLNRNTATNKITNDFKKVPDVVKTGRNSRRSLSCVEDAKLLGGYHWDCSDWVRRSQNPLPNITEVPGSEVPDSSSFHSNESNDSCHNIPLNSSQNLDTLDEEMYISYRSDDDDIIPYGFPRTVIGYPSQSDLSTNVCDIEDSDAHG